MMKRLFLALAGLVPAAPLWTQAPAMPTPIVAYEPVQVGGLVMEDQHEQPHRLVDMRGHVVVLIFGDRQSAQANSRLGEWLHVAFHPGARELPPAEARKAPVRPVPGIAPDAPSPEVHAIPVACIGKVPGLVRTLIRAQIRRGSPDVPVWLDFQDTMKQMFGLTPGAPNLIVIDRSGRLRYGARGNLGAEEKQQLAALIEQLRREPLARE